MELLVLKRGDDFPFIDENRTELFAGKMKGKWITPWKPKLLVQGENDTVLATVTNTSQPLLLRWRYNIEYDGESFQLAYHKQVFSCEFRGDKYELFPHRWHKVSIFRDDVQIGYYETQPFPLVSDWHLKIAINRDVDLPLICSLLLAINCDFGFDTATVNFGNLASGARKFDNDWRPG